MGDAITYEAGINVRSPLTKIMIARARYSFATKITKEIQLHPNRLPFEGVLAMVDEPSRKSPAGARGHRVILTRKAALQALPSLLGMAIGFSSGWDGHDARRKCGLITEAEVIGRELRVRGHIYGRDFPEVEKQLKRCKMGMSYEVVDARIADMRAEIWTITQATFTGAALLLQERAAYKGTSFHLVEAMAI